MYHKTHTLLFFSFFFIIVSLTAFFVLYGNLGISTNPKAASTISLEGYCSGGYYRIPNEKVCSRAPKCGEYKNISYDAFASQFSSYASPQDCMGSTDETRASNGCGGYVPLCCYEMERLRDPEMCIGYWERMWCHPTQCAAINNATGCGGGDCQCAHAWSGWCPMPGSAASPVSLEVRLGQVVPTPLSGATNTPVPPTAVPTSGPTATPIPTSPPIPLSGAPTSYVFQPTSIPLSGTPTSTPKPTSSIFQNPTPLSGAPTGGSPIFSQPTSSAGNPVPTTSSVVNLPALSLPKLPEFNIKGNVNESVAAISKVSAKPLRIVEQIFKTIVEYDKKLEEEMKKFYCSIAPLSHCSIK